MWRRSHIHFTLLHSILCHVKLSSIAGIQSSFLGASQKRSWPNPVLQKIHTHHLCFRVPMCACHYWLNALLKSTLSCPDALSSLFSCHFQINWGNSFFFFFYSRNNRSWQSTTASMNFCLQFPFNYSHNYIKAIPSCSNMHYLAFFNCINLTWHMNKNSFESENSMKSVIAFEKFSCWHE